MSKSLFGPTELGPITTQNRIYMAPLTRNRAQQDGTVKDMHAKYYAQRASAGLIITEATRINEMATGYIQTPGIFTEAQMVSWQKVTQAVHAKYGKIFMQLWHVGRISHTSLLNGESPLAPSAIRAQAQTFIGGDQGMIEVSTPTEMTLAQINDTIADYKAAAKYAQEAGFDGIEIHAANGYLIDQFLQDKTNHRTDNYGGTPENRLRFLKEVTEAVLEIWDANRVGVRLSPTGTFNDMGDGNPSATFGAVIDQLNTYGLAYLHMVESFPGFDTDNAEENIVKNLRQKWTGFYIANGDYDRADAMTTIETGYADAITFGRPFISNPDLPARLEQNAELAHADEDTFYGGGHEGYTDYPFMDQSQAA